MKTIAALLLLCCHHGLAADIQLVWDASPTAGVTNYMLYAHTNAIGPGTLGQSVVKRLVGTSGTARIEGITGGWWFTVTAWKDGLESDPSNVVSGYWIPPTKADAPQNMRVENPRVANYANGIITPYFRLRW